MYFNVCVLKFSVHNLQGSWNFDGVMTKTDVKVKF